MEEEFNEEIFNLLNEDERKIMRSYQNSKLNIYQLNDEDYLFRNKSKFGGSEENSQIEENAIHFLTSNSNLIYYTLANDCENIYEAKEKLNRVFSEIDHKIQCNKKSDELKKEIKNIRYKIIEKKFGGNNEFRRLNEEINNKNFNEKMLTDKIFRERLFLNVFFKYLKNADDIYSQYNHLLPHLLKEQVRSNLNNFINDFY